MIGYSKDDDGAVFIINIPPKTREETEAEKKEAERQARIEKRIREPAKDAVSPYGTIFPFAWLFHSCSKRTLLDDNQYYSIYCNNFVYTTDSRMFVGHYIPGKNVYEDLDPFMMIPAEYILCCGCCCPNRFFAWMERQMDKWVSYVDG